MVKTVKDYRVGINKIFSRYTRYGFVEYRDCNGLECDMVDLILEATEELGGRGEYKELFEIACKGFLKWSNTDKDDDGQTQYFASIIEDTWDVVYKANDPKMPHKKMYEWFVGHIDGSVIDYMEDYLYDYLLEHFKEPELLQKKIDFYNAKIEEGEAKKDDSYRDFQAERCGLYILRTMADMKRPIEDIRQYSKGVKMYSLKETMAQIERDYGNMDEVIAIYKELAAEEDKRGWARDDWHRKLMDIYKELGNKEEYHKELLASMALNVGDEDLWKAYKAQFFEKDWPKACQDIFSRIKVGNYRIYPWYAAEERYDLMMEGLEACFYSDRLKQYEKKLKALYPERCLKLLVVDTNLMAEQSNKRADYRRVAKNLNWICRYPGGAEKAAQMADNYRIIYKQRRAMMEEIADF